MQNRLIILVNMLDKILRGWDYEQDYNFLTNYGVNYTGESISVKTLFDLMNSNNIGLKLFNLDIESENELELNASESIENVTDFLIVDGFNLDNDIIAFYEEYKERHFNFIFFIDQNDELLITTPNAVHTISI